MAKPTKTTEDKTRRAAKPGDYRCEKCGERLSSPPRFYVCPRQANG